MAHYLIAVYRCGKFTYAYGKNHYQTDSISSVPLEDTYSSEINAAFVAEKHNASFKGRYETHKPMAVAGHLLKVPILERPTEKQLNLIEEMSPYCRIRFLGGDKRDASEWISEHMDEFKNNKSIIRAGGVVHV